MSEATDVLFAIAAARDKGERMALATIVSARGSTYRRPGARLVVTEKGEVAGNLSGGCLEDEVEQLAKVVINEGKSRLALFDLTADDEVVWGWGLGCNGSIEVFVEPAGQAAAMADVLRLAIGEDRALAVATVLESDAPEIKPGARMLVHPGDRWEGSLGSTAADELVATAAAGALISSRTETRTVLSKTATFVCSSRFSSRRRDY